jgi:phospholipid-translocating ATPase
MAPVFFLVLDTDVNEEITFLFPELYAELQKGRILSNKTFLLWVLKSVYQSGVIMILSILLFEENFVHIVSITFTSLICTELVNVASIVHTWNTWMVISIVTTLLMYITSMVLLTTYFDIEFIATLNFVWKVMLITAVSTTPLIVLKFVAERLSPAIYSKLR